MSWIFQFTYIPNQIGFADNYPSRLAAFAAMDACIDNIKPGTSYHSLKMECKLKKECENIPIGVSASITDGVHYFRVLPDA
jgi:hypothetical protein